MPGAISRTTGSAIRWNSFHPFFIRHGSDQPFNVATGVYGRPLGGTSGGCVAVFSMIGASGSDAAPALLTNAAPSSAAPEPPRKFRRETMFIYPLNSSATPVGLQVRMMASPAPAPAAFASGPRPL